MPLQKIKLKDLKGDLAIYFNFTANVLCPMYGGADNYLQLHRPVIQKVALSLMQKINYKPSTLYRGILLKEPVTQILPHPNLQYLCFSVDRQIALHFADVHGFGSEIMNVEKRLGKYGYVISYTPTLQEILFHFHLLTFLPYVEAFNIIGLDGHAEVEGLKKQKEVTLLQPDRPFTNITPQF